MFCIALGAFMRRNTVLTLLSLVANFRASWVENLKKSLTNNASSAFSSGTVMRQTM